LRSKTSAEFGEVSEAKESSEAIFFCEQAEEAKGRYLPAYTSKVFYFRARRECSSYT
jgi:hypothetical protein